MLAIDKDGKIARRYGSVNSKMEPIRGIFLIDSQGSIRRSAIDNMAITWPSVEETLRLLETAYGKNLKLAINKSFSWWLLFSFPFL